MMTHRNIKKYVSAFTLGDGSLRRKGTHAIYRFFQHEDHKDYVEYQAQILQNLTEVKIVQRYANDSNRRPQCGFETRQHPVYTDVYNRMYIDSHKVVSEHYLRFLDWECLAILHMDDGHLAVKRAKCGRVDYNVILATESFSYGDNYILAKAIKEKTGLAFDVVNQSVNGQIRHRLRLNKRQTPAFISGVQPYILPSFRYKASIERLTPVKQGDDIV